MLVPKTSATSDDPACFAVRQDNPVLNLERLLGDSRVRKSCLNRGTFIGVNPRHDLLAGSWCMRSKAVQSAPLFTDPSVVLFRVQNAKGEIGRFCSATNDGFSPAHHTV